MAQKSEKIINLIEAGANAIKGVVPHIRELLKEKEEPGVKVDLEKDVHNNDLVTESVDGSKDPDVD